MRGAVTSKPVRCASAGIVSDGRELEVGGDAVLLPIAVASRVWPVAAADLGFGAIGPRLLGATALLGLGQSAFGGGRYGGRFSV